MSKKFQIPTTDINYYDRIPEGFMGSYIWGEAEAIDICCGECDANDLNSEAGDLRPEDFNMMVDMCRVDHYFEPCCHGDWLDFDIDTVDFAFRSWVRNARLAHTFWGIQSHFAALGIEPNEELSVDFVKRAVSELIKKENEAKGESAEFEKARIAELNDEQAA